MEFRAKVQKNRANNQYTISIPKRKLKKIFKRRVPRFLNIREGEFEF